MKGQKGEQRLKTSGARRRDRLAGDKEARGPEKLESSSERRVAHWFESVLYPDEFKPRPPPDLEPDAKLYP